MDIDTLMEARSRQIIKNEQFKRKVMGATMPETRGLLQYPTNIP